MTRPRNTVREGYGYRHKQLRKLWAIRISHGGVNCARCGLPIIPGEKWDLDHDDDDRTKYLGASHARCNRATAGRRSKVERTSRKW
jgi:hypothetical protein